MTVNWLALAGFVGVISCLLCWANVLLFRNRFSTWLFVAGAVSGWMAVVWGGGALGYFPMEIRGALGAPLAWVMLLLYGLLAIQTWGEDHDN